MVSLVAGILMQTRGSTGSLEPYPYDRRPPVDIRGKDPVMLTHVGGESQKHFHAFVSLDGLFSYSVIYVRSTGSRVRIDPIFHRSAMRHVPNLDMNGNTVLNRVLMSHVVISEENALDAIQELDRRKMLSLKANKDRQTPLMLAVESGWPKVVEKILAKQPNLSARDSSGRDALDYLAFCQWRTDDSLLTPEHVYTFDSICQSLLAHTPSSHWEKWQTRAKLMLARLRQGVSSTGIIP